MGLEVRTEVLWHSSVESLGWKSRPELTCISRAVWGPKTGAAVVQVRVEGNLLTLAWSSRACYMSRVKQAAGA